MIGRPSVTLKGSCTVAQCLLEVLLCLSKKANKQKNFSLISVAIRYQFQKYIFLLSHPVVTDLHISSGKSHFFVWNSDTRCCSPKAYHENPESLDAFFTFDIWATWNISEMWRWSIFVVMQIASNSWALYLWQSVHSQVRMNDSIPPQPNL